MQSHLLQAQPALPSEMWLCCFSMSSSSVCLLAFRWSRIPVSVHRTRHCTCCQAHPVSLHTIRGPPTHLHTNVGVVFDLLSCQHQPVLHLDGYLADMHTRISCLYPCKCSVLVPFPFTDVLGTRSTHHGHQLSTCSLQLPQHAPHQFLSANPPCFLYF